MTALSQPYAEGTVGHAIEQFALKLIASGIEVEMVDPRHDVVHAVTGLGESPVAEEMNLVYDIALNRTEGKGSRNIDTIASKILQWRALQVEAGHRYHGLEDFDIADHLEVAKAIDRRFAETYGA